MKLVIGYLYGDLMNIYGDTGNIIVLKKRCQWRGIEVEVQNISIGDVLKSSEVDFYFFGGGQDQQQNMVAKDLAKKAKVIKEGVEAGVPLLAICGGYQLLGTYYKPQNGPKLAGIGLFPIYTEASDLRMTGNLVIKLSANSQQLVSSGFLVGFENHSGKTFLMEQAQPLGRVVSGFGNNGEDKTEGCVYKNAVGCYMHGSLLSKNPQLADWLIQKALETKYKKQVELKKLDDSTEDQAHRLVINRFS